MIVGVLLAAGRSSRFGGAQKLVALLGGQPVVRRSAELLLGSGVDQVVVVLGSDSESVRGALAGLPVTFATNARYAEGMSGSLHVGVRAAVMLGQAEGKDVEGIIVALGDQPTLDAAIAPAVIERFRRGAGEESSSALIVAPRYGGERSHPVLFARSVFPELLALEGDRGARELVARDRSRVAYVDVAGAPPADVDTPADLETLERQRPSSH